MLTKKRELITVGLLLIFILGLRLYHLDADPPADLSVSTDVYTDPPMYTHYAKHKIIFDDFRPFGDNRFVFYLNSSVTLLALIIFNIIGVSIFSSNLVGLIYSIGALLLFYLILRKSFSPMTGLIFLAMAGVNYNLLFYGRLPFQEHAVAFFGFLGLFFISYMNNRLGYLLSGVALAVSILFSKVIGLLFLAPYLVYIWQLNRPFKWQKSKIKYVGFIFGFLIIAVEWMLISYLPMKEQVTGYVVGQAFSLYGTPEGLHSIDNFIWKYLTFGYNNNLSERMVLPGLLGCIYLIWFFYDAIFKKFWKKTSDRIEPGHLLLVTMIIVFYSSLMIWNYRPLRYQLVLIYPIYGAVAYMISKIWQHNEEKSKQRLKFYLIPLVFVFIMPAVYQLYGYYVEKSRGDYFYSEIKVKVFIWSAIIAISIYILINLVRLIPVSRWRLIGRVFAGLIITIIWFRGLYLYYDWTERITFTTRDNSLDLGQILSEEAVVSGPFGPLMTLENKLGSLIHMFGVSELDSNFFDKYPITHLLMDNGNEIRARQDYPVLMDSAKLVNVYYLGRKKVSLYRVAGWTGNNRANRYKLSEFEQLIEDTTELEFYPEMPDNLSYNSFLAKKAESKKNFDEAQRLYKKAVEFSPTNYHLSEQMAVFFHSRFDQTGLEEYKEQGLKFYDIALKLARYKSEIKKAKEKLIESHPGENEK